MDTFAGSDYDTVIRVMDSCDSEIACDDDGIEWVTYPGGFVSAVEIEATEGTMLGIVVDAFSYSTTAGAYTLTITEGNCPGPGATCALDDGTDGVYDCDGVCVADTRGDGTCDAALECGDLGWDGMTAGTCGWRRLRLLRLEWCRAWRDRLHSCQPASYW